MLCGTILCPFFTSFKIVFLENKIKKYQEEFFYSFLGIKKTLANAAFLSSFNRDNFYRTGFFSKLAIFQN